MPCSIPPKGRCTLFCQSLRHKIISSCKKMTENQEFKPYKANYVTGRGGCQFLRDAENHLYVLAEAEYGRWFCRQRRKEMCSGSCYVKNGMVVRSKEHNHPASVTEVTVMVKKAAVLASIDANPQISTSTLVTNLNSACSSVEEHNFLPTNKTFARQIQKKKAKIWPDRANLKTWTI